MATAQTVIENAAFEAGVMDQPEQGLPPNTLSLGFRRLNLLCNQYSQKSGWLQEVIETLKTLTSGVASYTIGPTGAIAVQRPLGPEPGAGITAANIFWASGGSGDGQIPDNLYIMSKEEWQSYQAKTITTGLPWAIYVERGWPNSTIHLTGPPAAADILQLYQMRQITQFAALGTTFDMAPGYEPAITYTLGEFMCEGVFKVPTPPALTAKARKARADLASLSSSPPMMPNNARGIFIRSVNAHTWDWRNGTGR